MTMMDWSTIMVLRPEPADSTGALHPTFKLPWIVAHGNTDVWIDAVALFEFHSSGSGVTELFRLGSPIVAFS
jgi:hypothetical protein